MAKDKEGIGMQASLLWELFLDTGSPEVYLCYKRMLREAETVPA